MIGAIIITAAIAGCIGFILASALVDHEACRPEQEELTDAGYKEDDR